MTEKDYNDYILRGDVVGALLLSNRVFKTGFYSDEIISDTIEAAVKAVEILPAADVAPVVHSSWEEIKDVPHGIWDYHFRCRHCGGNTPQAAYVVAPDYCPCCGARMDIRGDDNEV